MLSFSKDHFSLLTSLSGALGSDFFQVAIGMGIRWIQLRKENLKMTE